ncbi:MAG: hypothetical protein ACLKAK_05185 [Alkaliphilus sp.]
MRRRKMKSSLVFYSTIIVFSLISYLAGYYTYPSLNQNNKSLELNYQSNLKESSIIDQLIVEDRKEKNIQADEELYQSVGQYTVNINEDTKIIFRKKYAVCNSTIEKNQLVFAWIGLSEKDLVERITNSHPDWKIIKFSSSKVVLYKEVNQVRPNHYYVTQENGHIVVYRYDETRGVTVVDKTNILITTLPQIDQDFIKEGVLLKNKQEVRQLLEDYSS